MEDNKFSIGEYQSMFEDYIDNLAKYIQPSDLSEFEVNLAKKNKLDVNKGEDLLRLLNIRDNSLFLNYFSNAELVLLKRHLINKKKREFTKEEVFEKARHMKPTFIDVLRKIPIDQLNTYDRSDIYEEIGTLKKINEKILFQEEVRRVIDKFKVYDLSILENRYLCIHSIQTKQKLDMIGLQDYIKEQVPVILERESIDKILIKK